MNSFSISKKDALKWLVAVAIPLIIWLMPVTETFTVQIRLFLMITIFAIAAMVMNLLPNMLVAIILPTLYAATAWRRWARHSAPIPATSSGWS